MNPDPPEIVRDAKPEPSLAAANLGQDFQFKQLSYFFTDPLDSLAKASVQSHRNGPRQRSDKGLNHIELCATVGGRIPNYCGFG